MPRYCIQQRNKSRVVLASSKEEAIQIAGCDKYAPVHCTNLDDCDPGMYAQVKQGMTPKGEEGLDNLLLSCLYNTSVKEVEARKQKIRKNNERVNSRTFYQGPDGTIYSADGEPGEPG